MEMQNPYSIIFIFFCFFFVIRKLSSSRKPTRNLPPGPWKLPLIGNLHQLAGSLPHRSLTNLANKYGPFMHLQLGQLSHIIVSSPEYAQEIMKTHDQIFANRPKSLASDILTYNCTDIIFSPYGNYWRQLRKICLLELFSKRRVQSFKKIREEEVLALVRNISKHEGSVMNLSGKIYAFMNYVVVRAACGKKTENVEHLLQIMEQSIKAGSGLSIDDFYPSLKFISVITGMRARVMKLHKDCDEVLDEIIREHKEKKGNNFGEVEDDLVDVLLKIQAEDDFGIHLSLDNIKAVLKDVFFAGTGTSAATIEWVMSELLKNPEAMKEAQAEVRRIYGGKGFVDESELHQLKYLGAVIKESFRLHPPGALLVPRENSNSCKINGYEITPRTRIIINAWAIGRDHKIWNEPERFEPKRFLDTTVDYNFNGSNFEFIPFGAGRRICPGITFAIPTLELLLSNLLYHFDWKLPSRMKPEEMDMDESFGAAIQIPYSIIFFTFFSFFVIHKLQKPTSRVSHIIVSSPEYAKEIMKTHDQIFANRPKNLASDLLTYSSIDIIFSPYGNYWRQLRKICTLELFSKRRVQSFKKIREEEVLALVRDISEHEGSVMNLSGKIYAFMNYVVVRAACGKKTKNVEYLLQTMEESIKLGSGLSIDDFYPLLKFISVITGMRDRT
ncbi:cytochrome P450 71D10-like [Neltuma alba]|uniref:cytochrome P450 71D10-like n=1 Tax=Neltuma alba TaxID=207710 RepID=UPI0010A2F54A|nr:cytochrome P450 71D10-like [Prosopis alba]